MIFDEEILRRLKKMPNGEYAEFVCRDCGAYGTDPDFSGETKVVSNGDTQFKHFCNPNKRLVRVDVK